MTLNVTRLEFFERGFAFDAVKLGMISTSFLFKYDLYKTYLEIKNEPAIKASNNPEAEAKKVTAERKKVHYSSVYRAILWFES